MAEHWQRAYRGAGGGFLLDVRTRMVRWWRKVDHLSVVAALTGTVVAGFASEAFGQAMSLPGQLEVSGVGSSEYSIAIGVPPGTGDLEPALSFEYSSQSGNGLLGMGWSLAGLPSIARCPQTVAQDGVDRRLSMDANDRFCMEGQRLLVINGGTYGADGTEYRMEMEGFTRIIAHGVQGTGPAWFEVKTKSGQTLELGNTADSRAPGNGAVRAWSVNKIRDTKGNYLTVTYTVDSSNGVIYPARIDYTGNASATPALAP